jgi:tetratricopeptide (TPR) repeat protein
MTAMERTIRRMPAAAAVTCIVAGFAAAQEQGRSDDDPDDRLRGEMRILVEQLTVRGMPEAIEALVADASPAWRIYAARAYTKAADEEADADTRRRFVQSARSAYEAVIALEQEDGWLRGLRRRVDVAQWRIELADLLLRRVAGPDLDRYELTSGLDFPRERLRESLEAALALSEAAGDRLDVLMAEMAVRDEEFLLLGLTETVRSLGERRGLGSAWMSLFLGMIAEDDAPRRRILLADAMGSFDVISRWQSDTERKYNALIGIGMALRELGRPNEALAALVRVERSAAPPALVVRASFERARTLIAMKDYAAARRALDRLAALPGDADDGTSFYVRLAPLIRDYVDVLEGGDAATPAPREAELRDRARSSLAAWMARGGAMAEAARAYMSVLGGDERRLDEMTPPELALAAETAMRGEDDERAVAALEAMLQHADVGADAARAQYQLGVCYSRMSRFREAAAAFEAVDGAEGAAAVLEQSRMAAYQSWQAVAASSRVADDYRRLAKSAASFADAHADQESAAEARWVAGLAFEEIGDVDMAIAAFERMTRGNARYWEGRLRATHGRQQLYDSADDLTKQRLAHEAARSWRRLGHDLSEYLATAPDPGGEEAAKLAEWRERALQTAAELYAGSRLRDFDAALEVLATMVSSDGALPLRLRCLYGLGRREEARALIAEYLDADIESASGATLMALASELVTAVEGFGKSRSGAESDRVAADAAEALERIAGRLDRGDRASAEARRVKMELARLWIRTGRFDEARATIAALVAGEPSNGRYMLEVARLEERVAASASGDTAADALQHAESHWARLLEDAALRDRSPATYWEARYHWLAHQLRRGLAREVAIGIEVEHAWYPDLGGPPWQGKLLDLEREARARMDE